MIRILIDSDLYRSTMAWFIMPMMNGQQQLINLCRFITTGIVNKACLTNKNGWDWYSQRLINVDTFFFINPLFLFKPCKPWPLIIAVAAFIWPLPFCQRTMLSEKPRDMGGLPEACVFTWGTAQVRRWYTTNGPGCLCGDTGQWCFISDPWGFIITCCGW